MYCTVVANINTSFYCNCFLPSFLCLYTEPLINIPAATCSATSRGRFNISWHGDSNGSPPTLYQIVLQYSQNFSQYVTLCFSNYKLKLLELSSRSHRCQLRGHSAAVNASSPCSSSGYYPRPPTNHLGLQHIIAFSISYFLVTCMS